MTARTWALFAAAAGRAPLAAAQSGVVAPPFAQAALWAADLAELRACDQGIVDGTCPAQPEHGGSGFLSATFGWRYVLNNLRQVLAAGPRAGFPPAPEGSLEATLQVLAALEELLQQPRLDVFDQVVRAARGLIEGVRPFLQSQAQLPASVALPQPPARRYWTWPSDGRTPLGRATFSLQTGAQMPAVGFGTWRLWAKEAYQPVRWALEAGYRHIDTAEGYANEAEIGQALRDSGVPRQEVFLATKASSVPRGLAELRYTEDVFNMQLQQLGTDYVDVYMLHTVPQDQAQLRVIWQVLENLYDQGRARALGVSNVDAAGLRLLFQIARVPPAYVQNLFKVYKPGDQLPTDEDVVALAQSLGVVVMGYSVQTAWPHVLPPLEDPHVLAVAQRAGRTPSQVLHRWALQRGVGVIPKSSSRERIFENARLLDFELGLDDMRLLDGLATLSETGAGPPLKPATAEDVYGLAATMVGGGPAAAAVAWGGSPEHGTQELLARTRDQGFPYAAIQQYLLGPAQPLPPGQCQQLCLQEPRCQAWEVCAPYDPRAGCEGCYLISQAPATTMRLEGWHAAIERGGAR